MYFSDMTRTLKVGQTRLLENRVFEFVKNLQSELIDQIYNGISAGEIQDIVEKEYKKNGYKVMHPTGHGVGLEIHEPPYIGLNSKEVISENVVFTIEPGVYLPKKFGVRFEDTILMKKNRCEILTR